MNILVQDELNSTVNGFQPVCTNAGHKWIWWQEHHTNAYDVFERTRPDIYIGVGKQSKYTLDCIKKYNVQFINEISPYTYTKNKKTYKYDILIDDIIYSLGEKNSYLQCDIGHYITYPSPQPYLLKLCEQVYKYSIIIIGNYEWNIPQHIGYGNLQDKLELYRSAKLVYVDSKKEYFNVISCGGTAIPFHNFDITYEIFMKMIDNIMKNYNEYKEKQNEEIKNILTYKNAYSDIFLETT